MKHPHDIVVLSIKYDEANFLIVVEALVTDRFSYYGFGTFLENVEPEEVRITPRAKEILLSLTERSGLQGMEFWPENRIAWASTSTKFSIPTRDINVPSGAKGWIKNFLETDLEEV